MKTFFISPVVLIALASLTSMATGWSQTTDPRRVGIGQTFGAPFSSSGLAISTVEGVSFRGSATVARSPYLLYTSANLTFENSRWAESLEFVRGWNDRDAPPTSSAVLLRGYRYPANYQSAVDQSILFPDAALATDFVIGFNLEPLGTPMPVSTSSIPKLISSGNEKRIIGYPATLTVGGTPGEFRMHQAGPFEQGFTQQFEDYFLVSGVTNGPGYEGGGVFDYGSGRPVLSGILVSGNATHSGVYALGSSAQRISDNALASLSPFVDPPAPGPIPGTQPIPPPANPTLDQLRVLLAQTNTRLAAARRITNPRVRAVQVRRLRASVNDLTLRIQQIEAGTLP